MRPPESAPLVLVIDDEAMIRRILGRTLEREGFRVEEVNDGPTGLARMAAAPKPDAIVLDVVMPGMDGLAVLDALKADPNTAGVPVVMVTGRPDPALVRRAAAAGAWCVLAKPWNYEELVRTVRQAIGDSPP